MFDVSLVCCGNSGVCRGHIAAGHRIPDIARSQVHKFKCPEMHTPLDRRRGKKWTKYAKYFMPTRYLLKYAHKFMVLNGSLYKDKWKSSCAIISIEPERHIETCHPAECVSCQRMHFMWYLIGMRVKCIVYMELNICFGNCLESQFQFELIMSYSNERIRHTEHVNQKLCHARSHREHFFVQRRESERDSRSEHMFNIRVSMHSYYTRVIHFITPPCRAPAAPLNFRNPVKRYPANARANCKHPAQLRGRKTGILRRPPHTPRLPRSS